MEHQKQFDTTVECMIKLWSVELVSLLMFMKSQLQIYDNNENGMEAPNKSFDFTRVVRFHSGISGGSACFSQKNPKLPLGVEDLFAYIAMFATPSPGKADLFANMVKLHEKVDRFIGIHQSSYLYALTDKESKTDLLCYILSRFLGTYRENESHEVSLFVYPSRKQE